MEYGILKKQKEKQYTYTKHIVLLTLSIFSAYADKPGLTSLKVSFTNVICLPNKIEKKK